MTNTTSAPAKRERHGSHHPWSYRSQAFRWTGKKITRVNLLPLANEMRAWMLQRGKLSLVPSPINALKRNGVWAEDGDFKLIPGVEFALDALEPM